MRSNKKNEDGLISISKNGLYGLFLFLKKKILQVQNCKRNFLSSFYFLENQNNNNLCHIIHKIEKLKKIHFK